MILADTHVLLWAALGSRRLSAKARAAILDAGENRFFSAVSIWEIAIKAMLGRADFAVDATEVRRGLIENGWSEIAVTGAHAVAVLNLPPIHNDPFDRMLVAQAQIEGVTLLTADKTVARYPGRIVKV